MSSYMTDEEARKAIVDIGKRMYQRNFVAANDGNISVKVSENEVWVTPTGVSKGFMTEEMMVKVDLEGNIIEGSSKPSSEIKMHLRVYKENKEIKGISHAHPQVATSFAIAGIPLNKAILPEGVVLLGNIPIAKYATPGTNEVPESIVPFCKKYNGVLLSNHGALTWGRDLYESFYRLESMEHYANILLNTSYIIGVSRPLSNNQIDSLLKIREDLGITTGGYPVGEKTEVNLEDVIC